MPPQPLSSPSTAIPQPAPRGRGPDFIANNLKFGKIGNGDALAIGFLFDDGEGNECLVVLTDQFGVLTPELAEILGKLIEEVTPGEVVQPVVRCEGCDRRIFGDLADRGSCLTCKPA